MEISILARRGDATTIAIDGCAPIPVFVAAFDSAAGRALRRGSVELNDLSAFRTEIPVLSIGGQIDAFLQGSMGLFCADIARVQLGDLLVSTDSALAIGTQTVERTCRLTPEAG